MPSDTAPRPIRVKNSWGDRIFNFFNVAILTAVVIVVLYPLYFIVCASFTDPMVVNSGAVLLYPVKFYAKGYEKIFAYDALWQGYANSFLYMFAGTAVNMLITIPAAYALSRKDLVGRSLFLKVFTFTMFFSGGLIPSYIINSRLGLRDNLWAMIIPTGLNVWNMIIARTFFQGSLPDELLDAAHIDGCSDLRFFAGFALPLSKAMLAVILLFYAVGHWNGYFHALIYLNTEKRFPLQLVLRNLLLVNQITSSSMTADMKQMADRIRIAEQLKYGIIVMASAPLLILYPFLQRYFVQGVLVGSLKG